MKYRILLAPLLLASATFAMDLKQKQVPLPIFAKNFESYKNENQFDFQLKGRRLLAQTFAENKIEELNQSTYLPKLLIYSGLAAAGTGIGIYGLYKLSENIFYGLDLTKATEDPSVAFLKMAGYVYYSLLGTLGAATTLIGGIVSGISFYKFPQYLPKAFEKLKNQEIDHYEEFLFEIDLSSVMK